jgi:large subunit ribosomal protein L24
MSEASRKKTRETVKKGVSVTVISGEHKGKTGEVLEVDREKQRVLVEGINLRKRATRPTQDNPEGGIVEKECPIHISNVMTEKRFEDRKARREAGGN